ncbi:MAG: alpha/beta fold hydrolase [Rhodospirillales bacterium]|nr:alpha/beta fold hydrolase [Rhodospirillales bacterium]
MATFILVPGAWHGAWCWAPLVPHLTRAWHQALTPELAEVPPGANPLPLWASQIAALAQAQPEPPILLGHSRGGLIISEAAAIAPHAVSRLVYLSAFLLPAGQSMQTAISRPEAGGEPDYLRPARGRRLAVAAETIIPRFYNLTEPETAEHAAARLHPEPLGTFSAPATPPPAHIPRAYIECTEDRVVPLALQRAMQVELPCAPVLTLPADHSPFLSMPEQLAQALISLNLQASLK